MKRKLILGVLAIPLLAFLYRVFAVYTVRSGECRPRPVASSLRLLTRDEHGTLVSFPERAGFPPQRRPLVVMTYNIAGHDELVDGDHVRHIAEAIQRLHPDIVARRENVAQLASRAIGPTFPRWNEQIDYIFADHGWQVRGSRTWPIEGSDHLPVTAELMWESGKEMAVEWQ